jgi:signal peptide peptidase SppA
MEGQSMKILDILNSPWAIIPDRLNEIIEIYNVHLKGEKIDIEFLKSEMGKPFNKDEKKNYEVMDGVAVIPIEGVIAKRMNMFTQISGGVSTQLLEKDFLQAINDPGVRSIILSIDSPGGTVDGTQELSNTIFKFRGWKPIWSFADGMMASAAYWIGSAAEKIYIVGDTTQVGSIGVVAEHVEISKAEEKMGVKTTEIYAGKYKRIASRYAPLSDEGREAIQKEVDYIYSVFVEDVARNRGVSLEKSLDMADGKVYIGKQSVNAGLVDGVSTLPDMINLLSKKGSVEYTRMQVEDRVRKMREGENAISE